MIQSNRAGGVYESHEGVNLAGSRVGVTQRMRGPRAEVSGNPTHLPLYGGYGGLRKQLHALRGSPSVHITSRGKCNMDKVIRLSEKCSHINLYIYIYA